MIPSWAERGTTQTVVSGHGDSFGVYDHVELSLHPDQPAMLRGWVIATWQVGGVTRVDLVPDDWLSDERLGYATLDMSGTSDAGDPWSRVCRRLGSAVGCMADTWEALAFRAPRDAFARLQVAAVYQAIPSPVLLLAMEEILDGG